MGGVLCCCCCWYDDEEEAVVQQSNPSANSSVTNPPYQRVNTQSQQGGVRGGELSQPAGGGGSIPLGVRDNDVKEAAKETVPEAPTKGLKEENVFVEEEDVCPTCLEEYTYENPRIVTKCSHAYHLSCIYEWMERSETCPICNKMMQFDEPN